MITMPFILLNHQVELAKQRLLGLTVKLPSR